MTEHSWRKEAAPIKRASSKSQLVPKQTEGQSSAQAPITPTHRTKHTRSCAPILRKSPGQSQLIPRLHHSDPQTTTLLHFLPKWGSLAVSRNSGAEMKSSKSAHFLFYSLEVTDLNFLFFHGEPSNRDTQHPHSFSLTRVSCSPGWP